MSADSTIYIERGPSQEKLFDCLRLGRQYKSMRTVEFQVLRVLEEIVPRTQCKRTQTQELDISIEGLHQVQCNFGDGWVFWGRVMNVILPKDGQPFVSMVPSMRFVFGEWHTRGGHSSTILFSSQSFFNNPIKHPEPFDGPVVP